MSTQTDATANNKCTNFDYCIDFLQSELSCLCQNERYLSKLQAKRIVRVKADGSIEYPTVAKMQSIIEGVWSAG